MLVRRSILIGFSFLLFWQSMFAQNIVITLPPNPPANTANWATGGNIFSITISGTAALAESNILVFIKTSSGQLVCGTNQPTAAQPANIKPGAPKTWVGQSAISLIGDNCMLRTGSYELCVQIFSLKNREGQTGKIEKCVPFEIREQECSSPNNVSPANAHSFWVADLIRPVTFSWTPIVLAGKGIVTYRLLVWEVEEGQTIYEALYNNYPIVSKDVKGATRFITPPGTFEKRPAKYVWRVIALDENERPLCKNAQSEPTYFLVNEQNVITPTQTKDSSQNNTDTCCANKIIDKGKNVNIIPANVAAIEQNFNITPVNIKYVSAEIVSVKESAVDTACMKCATHENWIYNFISHNTTSWNSGTAMNASPVNGSSYYPSKLIEWHCNKQGNLQFKLKIALPENKSGCKRTSTICIRYKFVDVDCRSCEQIICYDITN